MDLKKQTINAQTINADDNLDLVVWCSKDENKKQKPIVLVHGMPMNHRMWDFQIPYLEGKGYYVVAPDLRGCGDSKHNNDLDNDPGTHSIFPLTLLPPGAMAPKIYTLRQWAQDLNTIITDLGLDLENIHLVGESMGGAVVMQYMTDYNPPVKKVKQCTFVSAAGPNLGATMQNQLYLTNPVTSLRMRVLCSVLLPAFIDTIWPVPQPGQEQHPGYDTIMSLMFPYIEHKPVINGVDILKWLKDMFDTFFRDAIIGGSWEMYQDQKDLMNNVSKIKTPTRLIHGSADPFVPCELSKYNLQHILGAAEFVKIPSGGHGIFFEQIDALNAALNWPPS
ncbi:MAG: alpha/beta fold hydrolase [Halobacteriota archaeon]